MQSRESEQLGICRKLFNLIINNIVARGLKRVTMGPTTVHSGNSVEVPLEGSSQNGSLGISSELNHVNGIENWATFEDHDSPIHKKKGLITHADNDHSLIKGRVDHKIVKDDMGLYRNKDKMPMLEDQDRSELHTKMPLVEDQTHDSRRGVDTNGGKEDQRDSAKKKNGDNVKPPPRNVWHLFSVDEKSDEFIRRKKEAMRKNYTLDHPR